MKRTIQAVELALAACYRAAYLLHHILFLRPGRPLKNSRLFVVGSYRAGGAGKTPFCLWLTRQLVAKGHTVTILCHSYATDEVRQYNGILASFIRQGRVRVIATSNRYRTARSIDAQDISRYILCDDGFEDSRLCPDAIFRLDWEDEPAKIGHLVPHGKFRSLSQDHLQDHAITTALACHGQEPELQFITDSISCESFPDLRIQQGVVVCGLGDPERFIRTIENAGIQITHKVIRPDHDRKFLNTILKTLRKYPDEKLIVSEKDSYRLPEKLRLDSRLFIVRQSCRPSPQALEKISQVLD